MNTQPPIAPPHDDENTLKKYEELYAFAKDAYAAEIQRLEAMEVKTARYISLLALILGLNAAGFPRFLAALPGHHSLATMTFLTSFVALSFCDATAFIWFILALTLRKIHAPPVDEGLVAHFRSNRYVDVIFSMSRKFLDSTAKLRIDLAAKASRMRRGFKFLIVAVACAVVCIGSYTYTSATEVSRDRQHHSAGDAGVCYPDNFGGRSADSAGTGPRTGTIIRGAQPKRDRPQLR